MVSGNKKSGVGRLVHDQIRQDIISGKLVADTKLTISSLQKKYSVSMLTLRSILHSLSDEGFVVAEDQRGFFVAPLTMKNLQELADLRYLLESHMIKVSYANANLEWESKVLAAHHKLQGLEKNFMKGNHGAEELARLKLADYEFHCTLISGCDSEELLLVHKTVFDKYLRYLFRFDAFRGLVATQEHKSLIDSALSQDVQAAKETLKVHIYECVSAIKGIQTIHT